MSVLTNAFFKACQISATTNGLAPGLRLATKQLLPLSRVASFATTTKSKGPELVVPKKPPSAYFLYLKDQLPNVKAANPKLKQTEITSIAAKGWNELEEAQKQRYANNYTNAMEEYKQKIAAIEANPKLNEKLKQLTEEKSKERAEKALKKAKKERKVALEELGRPKRSLSSAYQVFYKDQFSNNHKKNTPVSETAKALSEVWNSLTPEQRGPYVARYEKIKMDYDIELEAWKAKIKENEESAEILEKANKKVHRKRSLKKAKEAIEAED